MRCCQKKTPKSLRCPLRNCSFNPPPEHGTRFRFVEANFLRMSLSRANRFSRCQVSETSPTAHSTTRYINDNYIWAIFYFRFIRLPRYISSASTFFLFSVAVKLRKNKFLTFLRSEKFLSGKGIGTCMTIDFEHLGETVLHNVRLAMFACVRR